MADELLDIVNENDEVVGQAMRSEAHAKGLWHREVGVFFVTPAQEVIFQIRGAFVDVNPNKPSATAGGHVKAGLTHEQGAMEEILEETGKEVTVDQLHLIESSTTDKKTEDRHNRAQRKYYGLIYSGRLEDLKVEDKLGGGFFACSFDILFNPTLEIKAKLQHYAEPEKHELFRKLQRLVA